MKKRKRENAEGKTGKVLTQGVTICLCMIVKDEAAVVRRALDSVRGLIDRWIVVDTGSTDGTSNAVWKWSDESKLFGDLYERPWEDFSTNRNWAIQRAEAVADYVLILDADDTLEVASTFRKSDLTEDVYFLNVVHGGITYRKPHLFRSNKGIKFAGVTHEALILPPSVSRANLDSIVYQIGSGGHRASDPTKFLRNVDLLRKELAKNPKNSRSQFYLAQSWRDAGEPRMALYEYEKRVALGFSGFEEEYFYALYDMGNLEVALGSSEDVILARYLRAYEARPVRAEPLFALARYLRLHNRIRAAYPFARVAANLAFPEDDILFVEPSVYSWQALDEWAVSAYWQRRKDEAVHACTLLLKSPSLPHSERDRVSKNLNHALALT